MEHVVIKNAGLPIEAAPVPIQRAMFVWLWCPKGFAWGGFVVRQQSHLSVKQIRMHPENI
jgi:hypothetical protein